MANILNLDKIKENIYLYNFFFVISLYVKINEIIIFNIYILYIIN